MRSAPERRGPERFEAPAVRARDEGAGREEGGGAAAAFSREQIGQFASNRLWRQKVGIS